MKQKPICINGVDFQKITEPELKQINIHDILFIIISQSGTVDFSGNIYVFTEKGTFFMNKNEYSFICKLLSKFSGWKLINLFFCDFLIINSKIYNDFVKELCARNIRDFWFQTVFEIYLDKYLK